MKRYLPLCALILLVLTGCIGTDFVDEPLGPVPSRLALSQRSLVLLVGESQSLSAQVIASDEGVLEESVSWTSRNPAVARVDADGLLQAVAAGQTWIVAATQNLSDSLLATVAMDPEALASITLSASRSELTVGDTLQLSVDLRNANGERLSSRMLAWESSSPNVAVVDAEGLVTALANGTTQLIASAEGITSLPLPLMVGGASLVRMGTFTGANGYTVQGTAILDRTSDQSILRFGSDFQSQSGPGLYVYLSPNANNVDGGVNLGELKATSGEQEYAIPGNFDPEDYDHVLVYCQPFRVPFGTAPLQ